MPFDCQSVAYSWGLCTTSGLHCEGYATSWVAKIRTGGEAVGARLCGVRTALCQGVVVERVNELKALNCHHVSEERFGVLLAVHFEHEPAHRSRVLHASG